MMKQRIKAYANPPTRIQQLRDALQADGEKITHAEILAPIDQMPARVRAVIAARGGYGKY
jgi:hypothetical protein